jgi:hypothetical protein
LPACCARAASGHAAAAPPSSVMNSRRFTSNFSRASKRKVDSGRPTALRNFEGAFVGCGSNSAVLRFQRHGCFTPETGHWLARLSMSGLPESGHG